MFPFGERKSTYKKKTTTQPQFEQLEKRELLSLNVWLPQDLEPIGGSNQYTIGQHLFRPVMTELLPQLPLITATLSIAGSFSFTSEGTYGLDLTQSGTIGSNTYEFTESGTITFSLYQEGDIIPGGFDPTSLVLTQTISLDWAFLELDGSGNTVQYLTGTETFTLQTTDLERFFWVGFNWYEATRYVSDENNLDLFDLNATSFSLQETGNESYTLAGGAQFSFSGTGTMPMDDRPGEIGTESYTYTSGISFSITHSGYNSFTLYEEGTYLGCYALGSIHYSEEGASVFTYSEEGTLAITSLASATRSESSTASNQTLLSVQTSYYGHTSLATFSQVQEGHETYSLTATGDYDSNGLNLDSVSYSGTATGNYALDQVSTRTDTGSFLAETTILRKGTYGANGCSTETSIALDSGAFTFNLAATLAESAEGTFTRTALGCLVESGFNLSTFIRTEEAEGCFSLHQVETHTQTFGGTRTFEGFYDDTSGTGSMHLGRDTIATTTTYARELSSYASVTPVGAVEYGRSLIGSALGSGGYSLSSYVFDSSAEGGGYGETEASSWESVTVTELAAGQSKPLWGESAGRLLSFESGLESFLSTSSATHETSDSYSSPITRGLTRSAHQAGAFSASAWSLSSISQEESLATTYTQLLDGSAVETSSGIQTVQSVQAGQVSGLAALGGGEFAIHTGNGTNVNLSQGTVVETSVTTFATSSVGGYFTDADFHESSSRLRRGTFSNHSYSWSQVVLETESARTDHVTEILDNGETYSGSRTFAVTDDNGEWSSGCLVSGSIMTLTGVETFSESQEYSGTRSTLASSSSSQTLSGHYSAGSYTMTGIVQHQETDTDWSEVGLAIPETGGTFSWTKHIVFRGQGPLAEGMSDRPLGMMTQHAVGSYSLSSADSVTKDGHDAHTLEREGTLQGSAIAFGTMVLTSEQSENGLIVTAFGTDDFGIEITGSFTYASYQQSGTNSLGCLGYAVATQAGFQTSTQNSSRTFHGTTDYEQSSSRYEEGSYSHGSYSLTSIVTDAGGSQTVTGFELTLWDESGGEVVLGTTVYHQYSLSSFLSNETPGWTTGTVVNTSTSTFDSHGCNMLTHSSSDSYSAHQEGVYGTFLLALGCVLLNESSAQTYNSLESSSSTSTRTSFISYTLATDFDAPADWSGPTNMNWGSATRLSQVSRSGSTDESANETLVIFESSNRHESGAFQSDSYSLASVAYTSLTTSNSQLSSRSSSNETGSDSWTETGAFPDIEEMVFSNPSTGATWYGTLTYSRWGLDTFSFTSKETVTSNETTVHAFTQLGTFSGAGYSFSHVASQEEVVRFLANDQSGQESSTSTGGESFTSSGSTNLACVPSGATASGSSGYLNTGRSGFSRIQSTSFTLGEESEMEYSSYEAGGNYFPYSLDSVVYEGTTSSTFTSVQYNTNSETASEEKTYSQFSHQSGTYPHQTYTEVGFTSFSSGSNVSSSLTRIFEETLANAGQAHSTWAQTGTFGGDTHTFTSLESEVSGSSEGTVERYSFESHVSTGGTLSSSYSYLTHTSIQSGSLECPPYSGWVSTTQSTENFRSSFAESGSNVQTLTDTVTSAYAGYEQGSRINGVQNLASITLWQTTDHDYSLEQVVQQSIGGTESVAATLTKTKFTQWSAWANPESTTMYTGLNRETLTRNESSLESFSRSQLFGRNESGTDLASYTQHGTAQGNVYTYPDVIKEGHSDSSATFTLTGLTGFTRTLSHGETWSNRVEDNHSQSGSTSTYGRTSHGNYTITGTETTVLSETAGAFANYQQEGVYANGSYSFGSVTFGRGGHQSNTQLVDSKLEVKGRETTSLSTEILRLVPTSSTSAFHEEDVTSNHTELSSFTNTSRMTQTAGNFESYSLARQEYAGFYSFVFASERSSAGSVSRQEDIDSLATVLRYKSANGSWVVSSTPTGTFTLLSNSTYTSLRDETNIAKRFVLDSYSLFEQGGSGTGSSTHDTLSSVVLGRIAVESTTVDRSLTLTDTGKSDQTLTLYRPAGTGTFTEAGGRTTRNQESFSLKQVDGQWESKVIETELFAAGSYNNDTLSLSSFVQDSVGNSYAWRSLQTVQNSSDTVTATQSGALAKIGEQTSRPSYQNRQDSLTTRTVVAENWLDYSDHQAGSFAGGELSMNSLAFDLSSEGSQVSTECRTSTTTFTGGQTGDYVVGNNLATFNGDGNFSVTNTETYSFGETRTYDVDRKGQGSGSRNSLSLTSLSYQAVSTQEREIEDKREAVSRFTSTAGDPPFTSRETTGHTVWAEEKANSSVHEWGTFTSGAGLSMSYTVSLQEESTFVADKYTDNTWGGTGSSGGYANFAVNAYGYANLSLSAQGSHGGLGCSAYHTGSFDLEGGGNGVMDRTESGTYGGGAVAFRHDRSYWATQSVKKVGTYSNGNVSFTNYWVDGTTSVSGYDGAGDHNNSFTNTTRTTTGGTGSSGLQTYFSNWESRTQAGSEVTTANGSSTLTATTALTFPTETMLKPSGPMAGAGGLSSMSLIGGVPLAGSFGEEPPEIPMAGPAFTIGETVLGVEEGWWLELRSEHELGPGRWPTARLTSERPELPSLDTALNYDPSPNWHWTWLDRQAVQNQLYETHWAEVGAWFELVAAEPSADPYYTAVRNRSTVGRANPWDGDFLKAFDDWLMARIRNEAMGGTNLPLLAGDVPLYGMDGNQSASTALSQARELIGEMGRHMARMAGLGPVERLAAGDLDGAILELGNLVPGVNSLASGDYVGFALDIAPFVLMPMVNGLARTLRVSSLGTRASAAINFTTGALVFGGMDLARQARAIARGEQTEYNIGRTVFAGLLGGVTNAMYAQTCFTGETPLMETETTSKPIKEFRSYEENGDDCDRVLTRDENDPHGPLVRKRVLRKFIRVSPILNLHVRDRIIETTAEHPVFVVWRANGDGLLGWLPAKYLQARDVGVSHDGQLIVVEGVADSGRVATVYNLEIEDCHTYFVGAPEWGFSVWAHNSNYIYDSRLNRGRGGWRDKATGRIVKAPPQGAGQGSQALDQLEGISKAQQRLRSGSDRTGRRIIDYTEGSQQTVRNQLRRPYDPNDWD